MKQGGSAAPRPQPPPRPVRRGDRGGAVAIPRLRSELSLGAGSTETRASARACGTRRPTWRREAPVPVCGRRATPAGPGAVRLVGERLLDVTDVPPRPLLARPVPPPVRTPAVLPTPSRPIAPRSWTGSSPGTGRPRASWRQSRIPAGIATPNSHQSSGRPPRMSRRPAERGVGSAADLGPVVRLPLSDARGSLPPTMEYGRHAIR